MKKYIISIVLLAAFFINGIQIGNAQTPLSAKEVLNAFPYQQSVEANAALESMGVWKTSELKSFFSLIADTSLQTKFTYALHAYVNKVALNGKNKNAFTEILRNQLKKAKSEDAKILFSEMLNLLTDNNNVSARLNLLPAQPSLESTQSKLPNSTQLLLDLHKRAEHGLNTIEKENIIWKASRISGISGFIF